MTLTPLPKSPHCAIDEIDPGRIVRHIRDVQADFADAIVAQLQRRRGAADPRADERVRFAVTARCIAAAVFGAMEVWMVGDDRSLGELARVCHLALETLRGGITDDLVGSSFVIIDKTAHPCQPAQQSERKAEQMSDYDAIVIGAGHNGLAAAVLLQKAGLRTLCLESKLYAGGMASTVELFDGYHFEIAGSVQFPTAPIVREAAGPGHDTDHRPGRDVGGAARGRRRPDDPVQRPDQAVHPPQRGARRRSRQRHGRTDGAGPWRRPGRSAGSMPARRRKRSTRCMPVPQTNSSARRSTTCCSARSPTCWTATCRTARSTARCAAR